MVGTPNYFIGAVAVVITLFCYSAPLDALAAAASASARRPEFYSELNSPLAQTAALYCENSNYDKEQQVLLPEVLTFEDDSSDNHHVNVTGTVATFAGGCFWGLELAYQREPGVLATCVGYTQGEMCYPNYSQVCSEETGHTEAVLLVYDPAQVTYARLADLFFDRIPDPTMLNRVGRDRGTQYRTGMYAHSIEQLVQAQTAFDREDRLWFGRSVVTEVARAQTFWPAEEPHQRYLEKGGRFDRPQSAAKGDTGDIRCYG